MHPSASFSGDLAILQRPEMMDSYASARDRLLRVSSDFRRRHRRALQGKGCARALAEHEVLWPRAPSSAVGDGRARRLARGTVDVHGAPSEQVGHDPELLIETRPS